MKFSIPIKNKLYQMFILGFDGDELESNKNLVSSLRKMLGGVIFFTQNIKSITQIKELIIEIKKEAVTSPFLAIDQEGGRVERTENIFSGKKYLSAKFAAQKGEKFLKKQTEQISNVLNNLGMNLNFAPVLDVNTNPNNPIIGVRAFSSNAYEVTKYGKIVVDTYLRNGIIPCSKHFPGHGNSNVDSHITIPKINLSIKEMLKSHIKPFKDIASPMIMVAHLHCYAFDKEPIPASLSKNIIGYLRTKLNYDGLIITDDMAMGALTGFNDIDACVMAIKAGVNILLYRNSYDKTIQIIENVAKLAEKDEDLHQKINNSFNMINNIKSKYII